MIQQPARKLMSVLTFLLVVPLPGAFLQAAEGLMLEEIVVTARKRSEDLQDTPISVTALTEAVISHQGHRKPHPKPELSRERRWQRLNPAGLYTRSRTVRFRSDYRSGRGRLC